MLPNAAWVPEAGSLAVTLPLFASSDSTFSTFEAKPCSFRALSAVAWSDPTTFGTVTCRGAGLAKTM